MIKKNTIRSFLYRHFILCFFLLVISGIVFGSITLDLFRIVLANFELFSEHGIKTAFKIGAAKQSFQLFCYGLIAMLFYLIFKLSESILVSRISDIKLTKDQVEKDK